MVPGGLAGAAVDDQLLGALGNIGVEVVEQHPERRLRRPRTGIQPCAAWSPDRREVTAKGLDGRVNCVDSCHPPRSCSARRRNRHQVHAVARTKNAAAPRTALVMSPFVNLATTTMTIASTAYMITVSLNGWRDRRGSSRFTEACPRRPRRRQRKRRRGSLAQPTRCPPRATGRRRGAATGLEL